MSGAAKTTGAYMSGSIGVTYGGYGVRVPPLFGVGVPYPHFLGVSQKKITATFSHLAFM